MLPMKKIIYTLIITSLLFSCKDAKTEVPATKEDGLTTVTTAQFQSSGMAFNQAKEAAMRAIDFSVKGQASILTYMDVFLIIGLMFLVCVPFILLIKDSNKKVDISEAMH